MGPTTTAQSNNPTHDASKPEQKLWRLDDVPGKDKGLFATQNIAPGTLILSDPAIVTTDCVLSAETMEKDIARTLRHADKDSQRAFLALHNNYKGQKNVLSNIIRSNGYPLGPNSEIGGVFINVSRINHSCRPNAKHTWNSILKKQTVYALRNIAEGEELTLAYVMQGDSRERQEILKDHFYFDCNCEVCSLPPKELKKSDARILRAKALDDTIGNWDSARYSLAKVIKNGRKLLSIYQEEGILDDRLPNLYWDIFQVAIMHGDLARASAFAKKYVDLKIMSEGPESTNALESMHCIQDPSKEKNYGETQDLKSRVGDIPKNLDEESFERWLWREDV